MDIRESIRIEGMPFPKPLPVPLELLRRIFSEHGLYFEDMGNKRSVKFTGSYEPTRLSKVQEIVDDQHWDVKVSRTIWPEYDDSDYQRAPLWEVLFPDLWIDEIDFSSTCGECGRKRIVVDTSVRVSEVKSKKPLHSVNGQFKIVSAEVKAAIEESLVGACFLPFDQQERYFYLQAMCNLGPLILHDNEVVAHSGECSKCNLPKFTTLFGPLRYGKSRWSGEDIVHESFHNSCLFTPLAFDLLRTFDQDLSRVGIALLD